MRNYISTGKPSACTYKNCFKGNKNNRRDQPNNNILKRLNRVML